MSEPTDPMSALGEAATTTHEMYLSYVKAGFTPAQALQLVIVAASIRPSEPS